MIFANVGQLEKQSRINDLDVVCNIQLHQIQCLRRNGEFTGIADELLLNEDDLIRLQVCAFVVGLSWASLVFVDSLRLGGVVIVMRLWWW